MKKYELTSNFKMYSDKKIFQIRALVNLENGVKVGELGGWIEKEGNLSHNGNAWVSGNAWVTDNAHVAGDAWVAGDAHVSDNAWVSGNAWVTDKAWVTGKAHVAGNAWVSKIADLLQITGLGTAHRTTIVYRTKNGIEITCGCFCGNLKQFREQVVKTREGKVRDEYLKFAELIEIYFRL